MHLINCELRPELQYTKAFNLIIKDQQTALTVNSVQSHLSRRGLKNCSM